MLLKIIRAHDSQILWTETVNGFRLQLQHWIAWALKIQPTLLCGTGWGILPTTQDHTSQPDTSKESKCSRCCIVSTTLCCLEIRRHAFLPLRFGHTAMRTWTTHFSFEPDLSPSKIRCWEDLSDFQTQFHRIMWETFIEYWCAGPLQNNWITSSGGWSPDICILYNLYYRIARADGLDDLWVFLNTI